MLRWSPLSIVIILYGGYVSTNLSSPKVGDMLLGVNGVALGAPSDKLAEASQLIRSAPRPLRVLFKPRAAASSPHETVNWLGHL